MKTPSLEMDRRREKAKLALSRTKPSTIAGHLILSAMITHKLKALLQRYPRSSELKRIAC